jgi:hypothetical protein
MPDPHRDLWSDDSLTVSLPRAEQAPDELPTSALVMEVRRFRRLSLLLQELPREGTTTGRHQNVPLKTVGNYRLDLEAHQAGRTVLLQSISLHDSHRLEQAALDTLLKQVAVGIAGRVTPTQDHERLRRPITGAVCVSSRSGLRRRELPSRSRFLTTIAEWMARRQ